MSDPLRPEGSRRWTPVSISRAAWLLRMDGYEVQFKRFCGHVWLPLTESTQHETRTLYRAREK